MNLRRIELALFGTLVLALGIGCGNAEPATNTPPASQPAPAPSGETVARLHWVGQKRVAAETTGTNLPGIWNLPASKQLAAQMLDRLSAAPWRLAQGNPALTNAATLTNVAAAQLRPLLEDLFSEESFVEVRQGTNQTGELAFAIRLSEERARLWETNLAAVLESLTSRRPMPAMGDRHGWSLKQPQSPKLIELARAGQWTVVGAAQERNALLGEMLVRIQRDHVPVAASPSNAWVEADFDLRRVAAAMSLSWKLPADWPRISLTFSKERENVSTRGMLSFARPMTLELEAWSFPTNLIHEPLVSFSAFRGGSSWLGSLEGWNANKLGIPPNELYSWALDGSPMQAYLAVPLANSSNWVSRLSEVLIRVGNLWLATNGMGSIEQSPDSNALSCRTIPFISPFFKSVESGKQGFVFTGLFPDLAAQTDSVPPAELLGQVLGQTNLVYYGWELTGSRIKAWIHIGQLLRALSHKAQLPAGCAGLGWLKAVSSELGNCVTVVKQVEVNKLSFVRQSTMGFSALELHLLADWLESPQFPLGLWTMFAPSVNFFGGKPSPKTDPEKP